MYIHIKKVKRTYAYTDKKWSKLYQHFYHSFHDSFKISFSISKSGCAHNIIYFMLKKSIGSYTHIIFFLVLYFIPALNKEKCESVNSIQQSCFPMNCIGYSYNIHTYIFFSLKISLINFENVSNV